MGEGWSVRRALVLASVSLTFFLVLASGAHSLLGSEVLAAEGPWVASIVWLSGAEFAGVGMLLLFKRRGGSVGWLCLVFALLAGTWLLAPSDLELSGLILYPAAGLVLVFPTGRLPSKRWRWAVWALAAVAAIGGVGVIGTTLGRWTSTEWENSTFPLAFVIAAVVSLGIIRIINDYRRARGEIRRQLKWLALVLGAGSVLLLSYLIPIDWRLDLNNVAAAVMFIGGPAAIGLAVLRYRLYDIDRIISRTVSYSLLAGLLGLLFFGLVAALGSLIPAESPSYVTGGSGSFQPSTATTAHRGGPPLQPIPLRRRTSLGGVLIEPA